MNIFYHRCYSPEGKQGKSVDLGEGSNHQISRHSAKSHSGPVLEFPYLHCKAITTEAMLYLLPSLFAPGRAAHLL